MIQDGPDDLTREARDHERGLLALACYTFLAVLVALVGLAVYLVFWPAVQAILEALS